MPRLQVSLHLLHHHVDVCTKQRTIVAGRAAANPPAAAREDILVLKVVEDAQLAQQL